MGQAEQRGLGLHADLKQKTEAKFIHLFIHSLTICSDLTMALVACGSRALG